MCLEIFTKQQGVKEESDFLKKAYKLGLKFSKMVEEKKKRSGK
jgi:hypothetical protein